jgi:transposase-like protein
MTLSLLVAFTSVLQAEKRRDKRLHAHCPFCHIAPTKRKHFSFDERRYLCAACHAQGTLGTLAIYVKPENAAGKQG